MASVLYCMEVCKLPYSASSILVLQYFIIRVQGFLSASAAICIFLLLMQYFYNCCHLTETVDKLFLPSPPVDYNFHLHFRGGEYQQSGEQRIVPVNPWEEAHVTKCIDRDPVFFLMETWTTKKTGHRIC